MIELRRRARELVLVGAALCQDEDDRGLEDWPDDPWPLRQSYEPLDAPADVRLGPVRVPAELVVGAWSALWLGAVALVYAATISP